MKTLFVFFVMVTTGFGAIVKSDKESLDPKGYPDVVARCHDIKQKYIVEIFADTRKNSMPHVMNWNLVGTIDQDSLFFLTVNSGWIDPDSELLLKVTEKSNQKVTLYDGNGVKFIPPTEGQIYGGKGLREYTIAPGGAVVLNTSSGEMAFRAFTNPIPRRITAYCESL